MGRDPRGDGDPTCNIAGIAFTGSNPVPATLPLSFGNGATAPLVKRAFGLADSSLSRNATNAAISSGWESRSSGFMAAAWSFPSRGAPTTPGRAALLMMEPEPPDARIAGT
jgi:hypothetical protein